MDNTGFNFFLVLVVIPIVVAIYFLPTIIAFRADHNSGGTICLLNLFLGGTGVAWVILLFWALSDNKKSTNETSLKNE